jgi:hypothetical protein
MNGLVKTSVANPESTSREQVENRKFPGKGAAVGRKALGGQSSM